MVGDGSRGGWQRPDHRRPHGDVRVRLGGSVETTKPELERAGDLLVAKGSRHVAEAVRGWY